MISRAVSHILLLQTVLVVTHMVEGAQDDLSLPSAGLQGSKTWAAVGVASWNSKTAFQPDQKEL